MSWLDRVQNKIRITTGDGRQWNPEYMNARYSQEFHYTEFHFIDVEGSLVDRKRSLGTRYSLELYFQGPDHIETARSFLVSAKDNRPWLIEHPLYDLLTVQPINLEFGNDEDKLNTTVITGTVIETIEDAPISNLFKTTKDDIPEMFNQVADVAATSVTEIPAAADVNRMADDNVKAYKKGLPIIIYDPPQLTKYTQSFNTAATYINTATATPLLAMNSLIAAIQLPGQFKASVDQRLSVLFTTFDNLRANIFGLVTVVAKQIFCAEQAACISSICIAAATPLAGDLKTKAEVLETINKIGGRFAQFIQDLDSLQGVTAGNPLSFVADDNLMQSLNELVNATIGNLYEIALGAKLELTFTCEKDTNLIELAHRLLGLESGEQVIDELMEINDISLNEILQVEKGRKIIYYV